MLFKFNSFKISIWAHVVFLLRSLFDNIKNPLLKISGAKYLMNSIQRGAYRKYRKTLTQIFTNSWLIGKKFKKSVSTSGEFQVVFVL
jgi:hypothetical protein